MTYQLQNHTTFPVTAVVKKQVARRRKSSVGSTCRGGSSTLLRNCLQRTREKRRKHWIFHASTSFIESFKLYSFLPRPTEFYPAEKCCDLLNSSFIQQDSGYLVRFSCDSPVYPAILSPSLQYCIAIYWSKGRKWKKKLQIIVHSCNCRMKV